jgi:hypothetical protein
MKFEIEHRSTTMNEGDFNSNFIWYEWGFVSPEQLPTSEAHLTETDVIGYGRLTAPYETWDEDNRWAT